MISVIVPYNKDRGFLTTCIKSIEAQTYRDFEIILSKGDDSVAVNFNNGLAKCKGEFCKFVTEDDWLPDNALQDLADGIQDYSWIFANAEQHEVEQPVDHEHVPRILYQDGENDGNKHEDQRGHGIQLLPFFYAFLIQFDQMRVPG